MREALTAEPSAELMQVGAQKAYVLWVDTCIGRMWQVVLDNVMKLHQL